HRNCSRLSRGSRNSADIQIHPGIVTGVLGGRLFLAGDIIHPNLAVPSIGVGGSTFEYRSEEHTSELQSLAYIVCRLLLEKKNHYGSVLLGVEPRSGPTGNELSS